MPDKYREAAAFLRALKGRTLITFQELGDADAVASAIALSRLIKRSEVRSTGGVDAQARAVLRSLGLAVPAIESLSGYSNVVIVDACTADSLGAWGRKISEGFRGRKAVIDHHYHSGRMKADFYLEQPAKSSTSEIVLGILDAAGKTIDRKTALLLAAGIAADTAFWKSANDSAFWAMARLLDRAGRSQRDYEKIVSLISRPPDHAMTEKLVEAVRAATLHKKGQVVAASTVSHAFHLQCAVALVGLGCDYAFVADAQRGIVLAARSDRATANVAVLMEHVARGIGGTGGGHEKVGGARGCFEDERLVLDACVQLAFAAEPPSRLKAGRR